MGSGDGLRWSVRQRTAGASSLVTNLDQGCRWIAGNLVSLDRNASSSRIKYFLHEISSLRLNTSPFLAVPSLEQKLIPSHPPSNSSPSNPTNLTGKPGCLKRLQMTTIISLKVVFVSQGHDWIVLKRDISRSSKRDNVDRFGSRDLRDPWLNSMDLNTFNPWKVARTTVSSKNCVD